MNSNKNHNTFYQEANNMQSDWGDYLLAIDELRDKFECNEDITIKEACYILWAEKYVNSIVYLKFKEEMSVYKDKLMPWPAWNGIFDDWLKKTKQD